MKNKNRPSSESSENEAEHKVKSRALCLLDEDSGLETNSVNFPSLQHLIQSDRYDSASTKEYIERFSSKSQQLVKSKPLNDSDKYQRAKSIAVVTEDSELKKLYCPAESKFKVFESMRHALE